MKWLENFKIENGEWVELDTRKSYALICTHKICNPLYNRHKEPSNALGVYKEALWVYQDGNFEIREVKC